jgi:hypothetical protein
MRTSPPVPETNHPLAGVAAERARDKEDQRAAIRLLMGEPTPGDVAAARRFAGLPELQSPIEPGLADRRPDHHSSATQAAYDRDPGYDDAVVRELHRGSGCACHAEVSTPGQGEPPLSNADLSVVIREAAKRRAESPAPIIGPPGSYRDEAAEQAPQQSSVILDSWGHSESDDERLPRQRPTGQPMPAAAPGGQL